MLYNRADKIWQVALVNTYYHIMNTCRSNSNWVNEATDGGFPAAAEPWKGLTQLRTEVQNRGHFSEALKLLLAEIRFVSAYSVLKDFHQICDAMEARDDVVSTVDVAHARMRIADLLTADGKVAEARMELSRVTQLRDHLARALGQDSVRHLDHCIDAAIYEANPSRSAEERYTQMCRFADIAHELKAYREERISIIRAKPTLPDILMDATGALEMEANMASRLLDFEADITHSGYFLAAALQLFLEIMRYSVFFPASSQFGNTTLGCQQVASLQHFDHFSRSLSHG
jgi:hypothetical protein